MQRSFTTRLTVLTMALAVFTLLPVTVALAHGDATQGDLEMEIGFNIEPAYAGSPNGVYLLAVHDGAPVAGIKSGDVTVRVTFGDETSEPMDLLPLFGGQPGEYLASFVPSQPGDYTFHLEGTIDGEKVDETMSSGPNTFDTVQDARDRTFPPVTAPTGEELASRIEQEAARAKDGVAAAQAEAASADDAASSARTVGIIGVVLGAIGVIAAIIALTRRKA